MPHLRRESEVFSNQVDGGTVAKMVSLQNVSPACFDTIPISAFYLGSCIAELLLLFYISVHTCNIYIYIYIYVYIIIYTSGFVIEKSSTTWLTVYTLESSALESGLGVVIIGSTTIQA
jgi:hypothetical protein